MSKLSLGTTIFFLCVFYAVRAMASPAVTFKTLVNFDGINGVSPVELVQATDGNFYGIAFYGGASSACAAGSEGCGTVFKITSTDALTTLYSLCSQGGFR